MNKWEVADTLKAKFVPMFREYFAKLESITEDQVDKLYENGRQGELAIDLTDSGINPYQLQKLLEEEFGYEYLDMDHNGWEMDFWIYMRRKNKMERFSICNDMVIGGSGITFTMSLEPYGLE